MKSIPLLRFAFLFWGMAWLFLGIPNAQGQDSLLLAQEAWRKNFPQSREVVQKLPPRDSLYIFFLAGQSNMAGRGFIEPQDTLANPRILTIDPSYTWIYAKEPLHWYEPTLTGLDCGISFAKTLLESLPEGASIALIPCAVGGSSIEQWLSNETHRGVPLLENFKQKVAFAQEHGLIRGILWHQGESNAHPELIPSYAQRLDSLVSVFREIVQEESLPMVLGELGSYSEPEASRKNWESINAIIRGTVAADPNLGLVKTGDLVHKGDKIHFDSPAQREMGKRYAKAYLELIKD